ncbi:NAD(P)/FAD-dependent oxidoreductase [Brachybacterium huguangmaarense]|uniref:NAD(P)/FAD-dependent oxidoreductase n=1 Tax=Brachybacterium huguangmaarense TaxID=1652028 RepID=A0ABY6G029_9MICO|nr:NAD(P)/FAD-dependent oxidoreductase [Brachybacterium huguangmaarense]UYG16196.1 NAD(P)/FAD-dependent oxidoreductase [Brachybacterium huguangmaarense]
MAPAPTMTPDLEVDVVVLGGGPVGENVAQYATEDSDLTAAIVEGELMGGECSYYACMPSKALLRPVAVADVTTDLPGVTPAELDRDALLRRRDDWVSHYDDAGQVSWAEGIGIDVIRGHGRLTGERTVEVTTPDGARRRLRARRAVVIATGSEPQVPGTLSGVQAWGSRDATGVREVPGSLLVVGGGVVACEAATWMAALGAEVTMLVRGVGLLSRLEPSAGAAVADGLRRLGVTVETGVDVESADRQDPRATGLGRVHGGSVRVRTNRGERTADEILVATGRRPRLDDLGLETIGLAPDDVTSGALPAWLHAVGDASGEAQLTHWGKYRARVVGAAIRADALGDEREPEAPVIAVPQVVFTEPQVAAVGMTAAQAKDAGDDTVTVEIPFSGAAGTALLRDHVPGTATLVADRARRHLVGATFVGPDAAELVHAATIAIVGQVPLHVLRHAVPSYPTASELWLRLLEEFPRELRRAGR